MTNDILQTPQEDLLGCQVLQEFNFLEQLLHLDQAYISLRTSLQPLEAIHHLLKLYTHRATQGPFQSRFLKFQEALKKFECSLKKSEFMAL